MINLQLDFKRFRAWLARLIMPQDFVFSANNMNCQELQISIEHKEKEAPAIHKQLAIKNLLQAASIHVKERVQFDIYFNKNITQYSLIVMKRD